MGVPAFFRWLSVKYPSIVVHAVEEKGRTVTENDLDHQLPVDSSKPNPNGVEFDNLYLDMNGIIHPCTHPENKPAPRNEAEMFVAIFECIDRLFAIVRPRRVLYMAIDGVAPRAKMNQQRSRRFRAGKEGRERVFTLARLRDELKAKGAYLPPAKTASERFDSNCITPGTPFFARLTEALHYYIHDRLNSDPGWRDIMVILSDANVPGEGEHKIMDYIRRQRSQPTHDPNTKHCLCGADADLIMLGLATHEPHFTIIREEFKPNQPRPCELCSQMGHSAEDCVGAARPEDNPDTGKPDKLEGSETEFIFIRLNILREYLQKELRMDNLPFKYEFERALDDWVFMCFFVGNDFLPHLPSLEIREKAIDRLVTLYKEAVYRTGGWLTDSGQVNLPRVQLIMQELGEVEDEIFHHRHRSEINYRRRQRDQKRQQGQGEKRQRFGDGPAYIPQSGSLAPYALGRGRGSGPPPSTNLRQEAFQMRTVDMAERNLSNLDAAQALKAMIRPCGGAQDSGPRKRRFENDEEKELDPVEQGEEEDAKDEVKLWEAGCRNRYYLSKFGVDIDEEPEFCIKVAHEYVKGLCWVLAYYYQGCQSWTWYFPYHYAPFASDFRGIGDLKIEFPLETKPFNPLEQLMGVFPADSKEHVPPSWQDLMTDPDSPIIDFYPCDFKVDLNGKKYAWQGVALLPFVDEKRLLKALEPYYKKITPDEKARNIRGPARLFCHQDHPLGIMMKELYKDGTKNRHKTQTEDAPKLELSIDAELTKGVRGKICPDWNIARMPGDFLESPVPLCEDIPRCYVYSSQYSEPFYESNFIFPARLLKEVEMPDITLKPDKFGPNDHWKPAIGMGGSHRGGGRGYRPEGSYNPDPMRRMVQHSAGYNPNRDNNRSRGGAGNHYNNYNPRHQGNYGSGDGRYGGSSYHQQSANQYQHQAEPYGSYSTNPGPRPNRHNDPYTNSNNNRGGFPYPPNYQQRGNWRR